MTQAAHDLAVVIVNYNTREYLEPCLASLPAALAELDAAIWVVDNASPDDSLAFIRQRHAEVNLIASPRNGGYAYGNNLGLRSAGFGSGAAPAFRHALLLNPDTLPSPGSLARLVAFLDANPDIGVCGPRVHRPDGSLDRACRRGAPTPLVAFYQLSGLSRLFPRSSHFARYNLTYLPEHRQSDVDAVVGACMLLRGAALEQTGLLDERFFMYGEDLDLCLRIKSAGWRVVYYPAVELMHYKGRATRKSSEWMIREFYRSMELFHQKHFATSTPPPVNLAVRLAIRLGCALARARDVRRRPDARRVGST
jgi:N-acetylglucosaminyl-diphospho-decaprenol L-rhamnosyltransferase